MTITADNLTRTYGTATAATTSLGGNVNGDTAGQIFSTAPTVTVVATRFCVTVPAALDSAHVHT